MLFRISFERLIVCSRMFGLFALGFAACMALPLAQAEAKGFTVVYTFKGGKDGAQPSSQGALIADAAGNLYGATGSSSGTDGSVHGTIFKLTPSGGETVLYRFSGNTYGTFPLGNLVRNSEGNLYGVTGGPPCGGNNTCRPCGAHCGTVFKLTPQGGLTVLFRFTEGRSGEKNGLWPAGGLVGDDTGNLYGTTSAGGGTHSIGTLFKITPDGTYKVLHKFQPDTEGYNPEAALIRDPHGNLYGTLYQGGGTFCFEGCGAVFELSHTGSFRVLHTFAAGTDGGFPAARLLRDQAGDLYGTAASDASVCNCGHGTVFKIPANGDYSVIYSFSGGSDGGTPHSNLILDKADNLYGTTEEGGSSACSNGCGVTFKLAPNGNETVLHTFTGGHDGASPSGGLVPVGASLFGTAADGGKSGNGTVFAFTN